MEFKMTFGGFQKYTHKVIKGGPPIWKP
jgi:hypothetical protein